MALGKSPLYGQDYLLTAEVFGITVHAAMLSLAHLCCNALSELFVGVILVPIVGNIAEHVVGVQIAYRNRMDFSMAVSLGSSLQVALFVTPVLVFLGPLLGYPLDLVFTPLELGALAAAVIVTAFTSLDGESNWLEGAMLCGVYVIAALAFFFSP